MSEQTDAFERTYETYKKQIENLKAFHLFANSTLSCNSHRVLFRITDDRTAKLILVMGRLALNRRLTGVALEILRSVNPNASVREWEAGLFIAAAAALSHSYVDVDMATGPEPSRWSDATTPFTMGEKLVVLETLASQCGDWIGPGWAAQRLAQEEGVLIPSLKG